jgi:hypothetical protein
LVRDLDASDDAHLERVVELLGNRNQSPWHRDPLIDAIARWHRAPGAPAAAALVDLFADGREDGLVRARAARLLDRHPLTRDLVPRVLAVAADRRPVIRAWVLLLLGESADPEMLAAARADESALVRAVANRC